MTPYTTRSGLKIGLRYTPALPSIQGDAIRLQTALLDSRTQTQPGFIARLLGAVWRLA